MDARTPTAVEDLVQVDEAEAESHPAGLLQATTGNPEQHHVVVVLDAEADVAGCRLEVWLQQGRGALPVAWSASGDERPFCSAPHSDQALDTETLTSSAQV